LFQVGLAAFFSSLRGALMMLLLVPCFLYRIRIEEEMLTREFGGDYFEYVEKSKKLIPGVY
jgi:protein-S-isoprenylcysteine O-methyltransferase Ste14